MSTSSFLISLPKCLGKLADRRPGLKLKHFLDGILNWTVEIEGSLSKNPRNSTSLEHKVDFTRLNCMPSSWSLWKIFLEDGEVT